MKKWIIIGAALTLVLGLVGSGYLLLSGLGGPTAEGDEPLDRAAADAGDGSFEVELGTISSLLVLDATMRSEPGEQLKTREGGSVTHLWLDDGATVEEGAPILSLSVPSDGGSSDPSDGGSEADAGDGGSDEPGSEEVTLHAPGSGEVSGLDDLRVGDVLAPGATVATVAPDEFRAVASVPANDLYRFYDEPDDIMLQIDQGPPADECEFLSLGAPEGGPAPEPEPEDDPMDFEEPPADVEGGSELSCRVPADLEVFDGVQGQLSVSTGEATDVVVAPVASIRGTSEEGEVIVVGDGGSEETREVALGLSDGEFVEVTDGLSVGESIVNPVPLDPRFDVPGQVEDEEEHDEFLGMGG
ncbi:HlyD family efflux transporter periplasmic adaptor subunit [Nocardiopsis nanhaiensis]